MILPSLTLTPPPIRPKETLYIPMNDPVEKKWREDLGEHKNERERERERTREKCPVCVCVCVRVCLGLSWPISVILISHLNKVT